MVTCRSVSVTLVSVPDLEAIHEYAAQDETTLPSISALPDPFVDADSASTETSSDESSSFTSVYAVLPNTSSGQFWIHTKIAPPHSADTQYYFTLLVNGYPIISWIVGSREGFRGTVRFVLGEAATAKTFHMLDEGGNTPTPPSSPRSISSQATIVAAPSMTVKVHRANRRKRTDAPERIDETNVSATYGKCIKLLPSKLRENHPRRYYKYSLLDPIDLPLATFRYYVKTREQLNKLGIDLRSPINMQAPYSPPTPSTMSLASSSLSSSSSTSSSSDSSSNTHLHQLGDVGSMAHSYSDREDSRTQIIQHEVCPEGSNTRSTELEVSHPEHSITHNTELLAQPKSTTAWPDFRPNRPLSIISEKENESPENTPGRQGPVRMAILSEDSAGDESGVDIDGESEVPAKPMGAPTHKSWPLDTSKPLPDLPQSGEITPRPRGGQGSSHTLLATRFPKFSSSSTISSMGSFRSSLSDASSDPFMPSSPVGRGDPLPVFELAGGLGSHPTKYLRTQSWEPRPSAVHIPIGARPSSTFATAYASSLSTELQRSDSVNSIGRAVSRPENQRPPTPVGFALQHGLSTSTNRDRSYIPRLGTPPVFFPQHTYNTRPSTDSDSDNSTVTGLNVPKPIELPPRSASTPPERPNQFPVRKSSLTQVGSDRRLLELNLSNASPSPKSPLGMEEQRFLSSPDLDVPSTPKEKTRADLAKFFGSDIRSDGRVSDISFDGRISDSSAPLSRQFSEPLKRKQSLLTIGREVWDSVRKRNSKAKERIQLSYVPSVPTHERDSTG